MKPLAFIVVSQDAWGKGKTLAEAADNCRKAYGRPTDTVQICMFVPKDITAFEALETDTTRNDLYAGISFSEAGNFEYPQSVAILRVNEPSDRIPLRNLPRLPKTPKAVKPKPS
jgi:hypothetical protein